MRLPTFRVRRLMVAVAATALALGVAALWDRAAICRRMALHHAKMADGLYDRSLDASRWGVRDRAEWRWHLQRAAAYERAARDPWLHVAPDPPMPPE